MQVILYLFSALLFLNTQSTHICILFKQDPEGRTVIYLGQWNEKRHLEWVSKNPSKMPKQKGKRK